MDSIGMRVLQFLFRTIYLLAIIVLIFSIILNEIFLGIFSAVVTALSLIFIVVFVLSKKNCPNCYCNLQEYLMEDKIMNYCPMCGSRLRLIKYKY